MQQLRASIKTVPHAGGRGIVLAALASCSLINYKFFHYIMSLLVQKMLSHLKCRKEEGGKLYEFILDQLEIEQKHMLKNEGI